MKSRGLFDVPTADWLSVSVRETEQVDMGAFGLRLAAVLASVGLLWEAKLSLFHDPLGEIQGTVKVVKAEEKPFTFYQFSGGALEALRGESLLNPLLMLLYDVSAKVTHLDVAVDRRVDGDVYLSALRDKIARVGSIQLGDRRIPKSRVDTLFALESAYGSGRPTGTIYVNPMRRVAGRKSKRPKASSAHYDKRQEQLARGLPDPGPAVRHELKLGDVGCTLRDVAEPAPVFVHYLPTLPGDVIARPWEPHRPDVAPSLSSRDELVTDYWARERLLARLEPHFRFLLTQLGGEAQLNRFLAVLAEELRGKHVKVA